MRGATAHKHYTRLAGVQREIFGLCRISGESLAWLLAARQRRVYEDPAFGKIPAYYREILSALWHEEFDRLHRPVIYLNEYNALGAAAPGKFPPAQCLRWQLRLDGVFTTTAEVSAKDSVDPDVWKRLEGTHIWNHKPERPFTPWEGTSDV